MARAILATLIIFLLFMIFIIFTTPSAPTGEKMQNIDCIENPSYAPCLEAGRGYFDPKFYIPNHQAVRDDYRTHATWHLN
jgi:hypothetical protein